MTTKQATQQTAPISKFGEFKRIVGTTGSTIYILNASANHQDSMKLLEGAGLTPFTEKEILSILVKDNSIKESLKGKWFYLTGAGANEDGLYTINEDGNFSKGKGQSIENTVRVWSGDNPLSLFVNSDGNAADYDRRFSLYVSNGPHYVAPVVVGKPKLSLSERENALIHEIETAAGNLRRSATREDLEEKSKELGQKIADILKILRPT